MYVVAGATGHVGSVVASALLAKGEKVKVVVRDPQKGVAWSQKGAEVAVAKLDDAAAMTAALKGAKGAFLLVPPSYEAPDFYGAQRATAAALGEAVKAAGVPHVVLLSSVGADLDAGNGPIKGLFHAEAALRASGTKLTAIRAGYFQENLAGNLAPAKDAGIFPNFTPDADYPMPMIATKDIGELATKALLEPAAAGEIVDLHGPAYSTRQAAEKLGAALGKTLAVVDVPAEAHVATLVQAGLPQGIAEAYAEMYAGFASGRITPKGDRLVQGTTTLDETIKTLLG